MARLGAEKILLYCCWAAVAFFFLWLLYDTTYFSSGFDQTILRDIDDLSFQKNLVRMKERLWEGQRLAFYSTIEHGYGFIYWLSVFIPTLPSMLWGSEQLTILIPRIYSVLSYAFCFCALYKISRLLKATPLQSLLNLVFVATYALSFGAATRFHNHTVMAALILWSFYFLYRRRERTDSLYGALFFGLAVGVKFLALYMAPVFIFLLNSGPIQSRLRENLKCGFTVLAVAAFSFSPGAWSVLWGLHESLDENLKTFKYYITTRPAWPPVLPFFERLQVHIFSIYMCAPIFLSAMALIFYFIQKRKRLSDLQWRLAISLALGVLCMMIVVEVTKENSFLMRPYVLVVMLLLSLIFPLTMSVFRKSQWLMLPLLILNLYMNQAAIDYYFFHAMTESNYPNFRKRLERFDFYRSLNLVQPNDILYLDSQSLFPWPPGKDLRQIEYTFLAGLGGGYLIFSDHVLFVFSKTHPFAAKTCADVQAEHKPPFPEQNHFREEVVISGCSPFHIEFEDEDVRVVRYEKPWDTAPL